MKIVKPPIRESNLKPPFIFLAGSIEMGAAEDWQNIISNDLSTFEGTIFNPRRDEWDSSWEQSIKNDKFKEQVTWELDSLDASDIIVFYFAPKTKSPISLLELGKYIDKGKKLFVICPEGFWRKGNIEILCDRYNVKLYLSIDEAILDIKSSIESYGKTYNFTDFLINSM